MTSQPDKLFRDKLENFQRPAPAAAWDRIERGLNKKNNKGLWMKIAAGIVLLAVAVFLLWPASTENTLPLSDNKIVPGNNAIEKNKPQQQTPVVTEQKPAPQKVAPRKKATIRQQEPVLTTTAKIEQTTPVAVEEKESTSVTAVAVVETPEVKNTAAATPSRTIVYTAAEVNAKYLRKKSSAEATPEEKKSSGVQKLMGLAYTLKNTDKGIGDLRQKKDEILALNFLSNEDETKKEKN